MCVYLNNSRNFVRGFLKKITGILHRFSTLSLENIMTELYYALAYPHLLYCNVILGAASEINLNIILVLRKHTVRVITDSFFQDHNNLLIEETNILNAFIKWLAALS